MRYNWIDGFKGFAVLIIILIHFNNWTQFFSNLGNVYILRIVNFGIFGVEITYILNAFLLVRKIPDSRNGYFGYVAKRLLRIIPIYYFMLIASMILFPEYKVSIQSAISHFLFFSILNPYWWNDFPGTGYVAVLVLCQMIFPLYMKKIRGLKEATVGTAIVFATTKLIEISLSKIQIISNTSLQATYFYYIFRGLASFSLGAVLYYLLEKIEYIVKFSKKELWILFISIAFLLFTLIIANKFDSHVFSVCFIFIVYISSLLHPKLIENPLFEFYGRHSFGIYLGHIFAYFAIEKLKQTTIHNICGG